MSQDQHPGAEGDFFVTFFLVVSDQDRSRNFYQSVFGGKVLLEHDPVILEVANARLILNDGGGPTDDKPTVTLTTPPDPDQVSAFLNIRVTDIATASKIWSARGAEFLTEPKDHGREIRAYIRDPDGHLIEVGQTPPRQARKAVSRSSYFERSWKLTPWLRRRRLWLPVGSRPPARAASGRSHGRRCALSGPSPVSATPRRRA